ncbi:MAG: hypothetical protein ACLTYW_10970 [Collinsella sp.]
MLATLAAGGDINIPALLAKQIILGVGLGLAIGWAAGRLIERAHATAEARRPSSCSPWPSSPTRCQATGRQRLLAVYLAGIVLGAATSPAKSRWRTSLTPSPRWRDDHLLLARPARDARTPAAMLLPGLALMAFML